MRAILRASEVMLGKPVETYYSPSAFDQGYLNHVGIATANFGAGEHQYAHTDYDMASVERTDRLGARLCLHDAGLSDVSTRARAVSSVVQMAGGKMPRRDLLERRRSLRQRGIACGQRGWKWQPGGGCERRGDLALDRRRRRCLRASSRGTSASSACV